MDEENINCQNKFNSSHSQSRMYFLIQYMTSYANQLGDTFCGNIQMNWWSLSLEPTCSSFWDGVYCWPPTPPNTTVQMPCRDIFAVAIEHFQQYSSEDYMKYFAYRKCSDTSEWDWNSWTNYTECLTLLALQVRHDINCLSNPFPQCLKKETKLWERIRKN